MGGSLWRHVREGAEEAGDTAKQANAFRRQLKEDKLVLPKLRKALVDLEADRQVERDTDHLHASEISKTDWCPRASYYTITGVEPEKQKRDGNVTVYAEGRDIHERVQTALWRLGDLSGNWHCKQCDDVWWARSPKYCQSCSSIFIEYYEVPIQDESIRLLGQGDGLVEETQKGTVLLEVKSIGLGSVRMEVPGIYRGYENKELDVIQLWEAIRRPFPSHIKQTMLYLRALRSIGVTTAVILYEYKVNQAQKEFVLRYQPKIIEPIVDQAKAVVQALADGTQVRRPEWAEDENTKTCKACVFRTTCWRLNGNVQASAVKAPALVGAKSTTVRVLPRR